MVIANTFFHFFEMKSNDDGRDGGPGLRGVYLAKEETRSASERAKRSHKDSRPASRAVMTLVQKACARVLVFDFGLALGGLTGTTGTFSHLKQNTLLAQFTCYHS